LIKEFKNIWEGLRVKDSFARNLAISFSGQAVGQILGFAFTPFIARTYGPDNYGIFALFFAIASNISLVSTFQLPTGYVSASSKKDLHILIQITFFVLSFFTILSALILFFFKERAVLFFEAGNLDLLIYLIPVYVLFMGVEYIMLGWNIYLKQFGRGAMGKIASIVTSKGLTLLYGILMVPSPIGLIGGNFTIYPLEVLAKLSPQIRADVVSLLKPFSWQEIKNVCRRFKSYPLLVTPGLLVTSISGQLPVYCFSVFFQNSYIGLFALANSIITVPISVITNSTTTVFLQKAAETNRTNPAVLKNLVLALHKRLFLISFLPLILFALISDWVFSFIFGAAWQEAGWIASFLAVSTILAVSQQPLSVLFRLLNREQDNFILNVISIGLKLGGLSVGVFYNDVKIAVAAYSLTSILSTSLSLTWIFRMVQLSFRNLIWYVLVVLAIFVVIALQKF